MKITQREKDIWRAALTLSHNLCVQHSNRLNADDESLGAVEAAGVCAQRILQWLKPTDDQLTEMFNEAGVTDQDPMETPKTIEITMTDAEALELRTNLLARIDKLWEHMKQMVRICDKLGRATPDPALQLMQTEFTGDKVWLQHGDLLGIYLRLSSRMYQALACSESLQSGLVNHLEAARSSVHAAWVVVESLAQQQLEQGSSPLPAEPAMQDAKQEVVAPPSPQQQGD